MPYLSMIVVAAVVIAVVDIANANEHDIRGLPRDVWIFVAIVVPLAGCIAWFVAGRPRSEQHRRIAREQRERLEQQEEA